MLYKSRLRVYVIVYMIDFIEEITPMHPTTNPTSVSANTGRDPNGLALPLAYAISACVTSSFSDPVPGNDADTPQTQVPGIPLLTPLAMALLTADMAYAHNRQT